MILPLLLGSSALAFAPSSETYIGQEPTRLMRFHTEQQHRLRHSAAWQSFLSGPGAGWMVCSTRTATATATRTTSLPHLTICARNSSSSSATSSRSY